MCKIKTLIEKKILLSIICFFFINLLYANCNTAKDFSRVVVAGGAITEIIYLLGLEKHLVGVDVTSVYPSKAKELPSIGYVRKLSSEGVFSLLPTLILAENDIGPPTIVKQIEETSIDLRIINDKLNMSGIKEKIICIAKIFNLNTSKFEKIDKEINLKIDRINQLKLDNLNEEKRFLIILMMKGTSPVVAGLNTSGHGFLNSLGLINVMKDIEGWKPVGKEEIILSNPDHIIITERAYKGFSSRKKFFNETGINLTDAGRNNKLIIEDGMALLGFGPRTLDTALKISETSFK